MEKAWEEVQVHQYEKIEPRFYKEKKGRKSEYLNGWTTIQERIEAETNQKKLWDNWLTLYQEYFKKYGIRLGVPMLYREYETPDGKRFKRS